MANGGGASFIILNGGAEMGPCPWRRLGHKRPECKEVKACKCLGCLVLVVQGFG